MVGLPCGYSVQSSLTCLPAWKSRHVVVEAEYASGGWLRDVAREEVRERRGLPELKRRRIGPAKASPSWS